MPVSSSGSAKRRMSFGNEPKAWELQGFDRSLCRLQKCHLCQDSEKRNITASDITFLPRPKAWLNRPEHSELY